MHSINPKVYQLQHEIHTIQGQIRNAQCRSGMSNPSIVNNYRDMIRTRKELIALLQQSDDVDEKLLHQVDRSHHRPRL